jgi:cation/acetate symporter
MEIRVARRTAAVIGALSIVGGVIANGQNVAFLVSLALAIAASANLPTIVYALYWKRFSTAGALASVYSGLASSVLLIVFSTTVSRAPTSILPDVDFHWFPLTNPGLVSIPFAFLCGFLATLWSPAPDPVKQEEMEVRATTGLGSGLRQY